MKSPEFLEYLAARIEFGEPLPSGRVAVEIAHRSDAASRLRAAALELRGEA